MKLLCIALLLLSLSAGPWAAELTRDGEARAVIVCPGDATAPERNAALELASYIEKISGALLPVEEAPSDAAYNIYVGQTGAVRSLAGDFDWDSLKSDGNLIEED